MIEEIFRLDKKVIVVTGSSGLLGSKHSEAIASQGGNLVLIDIDIKGKLGLKIYFRLYKICQLNSYLWYLQRLWIIEGLKYQ